MHETHYQSRFRSTLDKIADDFDAAQGQDEFDAIARALLNVVSVVSPFVLDDMREHLDDQGKNMDTLGCVTEMGKRIYDGEETRKDFTSILLIMLVYLREYWEDKDARFEKVLRKTIRQLHKHPDVLPGIRRKAEKDFG